MIDQFDALVNSQQPAVVPWTPVTDYSFEARKAIEGDHPRLILYAFQPSHVLDVGCGFNHLAKLINALAGRMIAYGADLHNPYADFRHDITEPMATWNHVPSDLVICREVLEHLTVRQIRRAVTNLCTLTTRYVYVTTRFHQQPSHLLDVATSDDLDPTHISLCHKDLIRALFVLEGFTRRADLEAILDWKKLGRVLVYERV